MIGKTLSHYRITAALGAGGMGEVYRATDTMLNREVAIKVLPAEVGQDPERLARFRREAQLLAALNHPNIAAIHGLEEADGTPFLALELVEGEDLKERLGRGAIPVEEAIEIAEKIAEALEEAHNHGIVHRDFKPANVKVTPEGKVKVLDFGLAKAWAGDAGDGAPSASMSQSPTLAHTGTAAGIILGTAAYMSPEQARGKPVDKRADVWAFGVLLWEMLTGHALFRGETVTDVIAAVMTKDPDLDALPAETPRALRRLIARCLRRDPRARIPDIGSARLDLQEVLAGASEDKGVAESVEGLPSTAERRRQARERWAWAAALVVSAGVAAALGVLLSSGEAPEARPVAHFLLDVPDDVDLRPFAVSSIPGPAVSPDGRHVAFVGHSGGTSQVWIRSLGTPGSRPLPGTEGAQVPFWSPDGGSVAFATTGGDLKKLVLGSGTAQKIASLPYPLSHGGTWNDGGTIVVSSGGDLYAVRGTGVMTRRLETREEGDPAHRWPQFLPDGRHFLYVVSSSPDPGRGGLYVASLDAPQAGRRLARLDGRFAYASGYLLFHRDRILFAQPFDAGRLELSGEPVPVAEGVASNVSQQWGYFGVSPSGVLAYIEVGEFGLQLTWLDRSGERLEAVGDAGAYGQVVLSPDGRRVALEEVGEEGTDVWVMDVSRGVASRVTSAPGNETDPVWSPDGQELVYHAGGSAYRQGLGTGASAVPLFDPAVNAWPESWSSDGETLFYILDGAFWALPMNGEGSPELVLETEFALDEPQVSPDGRWLAYISRESGDWEVYVEPFRRSGERVRVSTDGGGQPKWRADGRELFYQSGQNTLMAVAAREEDGHLEVGLPTPLFEIPVVQREQVDDYAVSPDGQRFLVKTRAGARPNQKIHVVTNWPSLLE